MLEIPETCTISRQLEKTVCGQEIVTVQAGLSPHRFAFYFGEPEKYEGRLKGQRFQRALALGGLVELQAGKMRVVVGDGANLRYFAKGEAFPPKHQLCLGLSGGGHLVVTVAMYGAIWAFEEGEMDDNYYFQVAREKPSPLMDAFDRAYFDVLWQEAPGTMSAKAFLATKQRIPGLGNGVLQDILLRARVHPQRPKGTLNLQAQDCLFEQVKGTLKEMADLGGRDTERDLFGVSGGYRTLLSSKSMGKPCPFCGGNVTRKSYLGGNVYFCALCQSPKGAVS